MQNEVVESGVLHAQAADWGASSELVKHCMGSGSGNGEPGVTYPTNPANIEWMLRNTSLLDNVPRSLGIATWWAATRRT